MGIIKMKKRIRILNIVLKINFIPKVYHKGFLYQDVRIPVYQVISYDDETGIQHLFVFTLFTTVKHAIFLTIFATQKWQEVLFPSQKV
jgi:hypothetical protein